MQKYRVRIIQTLTSTFDNVEAPNKQEAIGLATSGKAEETDYENETNYETEELEE